MWLCRQEVLVRFWLQSVSRLTSAAWEDASTKALQPLLQVTLEVYSAVVQQRWVKQAAATKECLMLLSNEFLGQAAVLLSEAGSYVLSIQAAWLDT